MKRILIISYYWPPSGGSGVQRWLKFAKFLPEFGWQPVVYTPDNPSFKTQDESLLSDVPREAEIIKTKIWEPYGIYQRIKGDKNAEVNFGVLDGKGSKGGMLSNLAQWARGNLFIPDPKVFWVKPSVKYLYNYLKDNPVDIIVSTGPPHSMHLIGLGLKRKLKIPWIADFRDPWTKLDLLEDYRISENSRRKYERLEQEVLAQSDLCLTVSNNWGRLFSDLGAKKVSVITNGFDVKDTKVENHPNNGNFILSHFGLMNHLRNPTQLWKALSEIVIENSDLRNDLEVHLGGKIDPKILAELTNYPEVANMVSVHPYVSHTDVLDWYRKSSVLLLLSFSSEIGKGNTPGKLFEYLAVGRKILAFGQPKSDVESILNETGAGINIAYDEEGGVEEVKNFIKDAYVHWKSGDMAAHSKEKIDKFDRRHLTARLVNQMEGMLEEKE